MNVYPMEWVGYRKTKEAMVFAQLAYPILTEEDSSSEEDITPSSYKIYTSKDDYEGKEVKSSQLFKIGYVEEESGSIEPKASSEGYILQTCGASSSFSATHTDKKKGLNNSKPDKKEGWRYIKQAERDYEVAELLLEHVLIFILFVFFPMDEVAEKSLRGLLLCHCGKDNREEGHSWHNLQDRIKHLCLGKVGKSTRNQLTRHVTDLEDYYLHTRFPDKWPNCDDIPADLYTKKKAESALADVKQVLRLVTSNMHK